jgi:TonB family protein
LTLRFESQGMVVIERHASDRGAENHPGLLTYQPCDPGRLDQPLQPINTVSPAYPRALREKGAEGSVVLEYYVDESGRVRMPVISYAEHQALAGLSLAAIEQWEFQPPVSRNKPVLVRVRQKFEFVAERKG